MNYKVINLKDEQFVDKTPDQIRPGIDADYVVIISGNSEHLIIPEELHDKINLPETGAVYCEGPNEVFPIIQPQLQWKFSPKMIAIKTQFLNNETTDFNNLFETIIRIYNKAIVRRV